MTIDFSDVNYKASLGLQVRAILGVPEEFLPDDVISSPIFLNQAKSYINKQVASYEEKKPEQPENPENPEEPETPEEPPVIEENISLVNNEDNSTEEPPTKQPTEPEKSEEKPEESEPEDSTTVMLLKIAYIYYICYLLCLGMYSRLPKQMENVNTKTILLSINWNQMAEDMLNKCNQLIDEAIEELDEELEYGNTFAVLSDASEYPNTLI